MPPTSTPPSAPIPRRSARPKWLDLRVLGGALIVIVSVAAGAKVLSDSDRTVPVWAASADLSTGTVLAETDLVVEHVNLGSAGGVYIDASSPLVGSALARAVGAGELIPAVAVQPGESGRVVSVAVTPDHMAPGVGHGSVVDLYLTTGRAAVVGEEVVTELVQAGVTVQSVTAPAGGGLSGAISSKYQVAVLLEPGHADDLVRKLPHGDPIVVLQARGVVAGAQGR